MALQNNGTLRASVEALIKSSTLHISVEMEMDEWGQETYKITHSGKQIGQLFGRFPSIDRDLEIYIKGMQAQASIM